MTTNEEIEKSYRHYISEQYKIAGFPAKGTTINKQVFLDRYDEIPELMTTAIEAIKNKQNVFVMLDANDLQWKYDIVCYLFNTFYVHRANIGDDSEEAFCKWVDSPIWFPKFDRNPDYDAMKGIKFIYLDAVIDFATHYKNHVYLLSNLITFRKNSNVTTIMDAGDGERNIFKTIFEYPIFSENTKKMLLSDSIYIKMSNG